MHGINIILTASGILLEGRSSFQMCGEVMIDNLEDFLLCDCFDSSIEGRCSVDKLGKPDLDKYHLIFQGRWKSDPLLHLYLCSSSKVELFEQFGRIFLCPRTFLGLIAARFFQQFNHFINLTTSICVLQGRVCSTFIFILEVFNWYCVNYCLQSCFGYGRMTRG